MWRRGGGDFRFRSEDSDCFWRSVVAAEGKEASVSSLIGFSGEDGSYCWNLRFICNFYDWELEGLDFLMDLLF